MTRSSAKRIKPSKEFIMITRNPKLKAPVRYEPVKKEPGSFVLTSDGLKEVK